MEKSKKMGGRALVGSTYLGLGIAIKTVLTMISVVVTARLLSPDDFGVAAMAAPITGFLLIFQNMGLNQAVVQSRDISEEQINTLFWVNMIASVALSLIFLALSPLVGIFYGDARAGYVTAASAITVLVTGGSLQHTALLNRAMDFKRLVICDVSASVFSLIGVVVSAYLLRSYWAIWIGNFTYAIIYAALVWSSSRWRPVLRFTIRGARSLIEFGANVTGNNLISFVATNIDNVLIARVWGAIQLGLYDRSYKLMLFPVSRINAPLGRVMLPVLSRLVEEPERFRRTYLRATRALMLLSVPGITAAACVSEQLVPLLLGAHWAAAAPIFMWLSIAATLHPLSNSTNWLFLSTGHPAAQLKLGLISSVIHVACLVAGLYWGAAGVAVGFLASQLVRTPILFSWSASVSPVRRSDFYAMLMVPAIAGLISYVILQYLSAQVSDLTLIITAVFVVYALNFLGQLATGSGRDVIEHVYVLARDILVKRRARSTREDRADRQS